MLHQLLPDKKFTLLLLIALIHNYRNTIGQTFLGSDALVCKKSYTYLKSNITSTSYLWSTGETTPNIKVYKSGNYTLKLDNGNIDTIQIVIKEEKQHQANNWLLGNNVYLNFDTIAKSPTIKTPANHNIIGGSASLSDPAGNLRLYTDGDFLFANDGSKIDQLSGRTDIGSNTLLIPEPYSARYVYLFYIKGNSIFYSKIDMSLNNGKGGVVPNLKNVLLASGMNMKMAATTMQGIDEQNVWLVTQKENSNSFLSFKITENGVQSNAIESIAGTKSTESSGYLKFLPDGSKLATSGVNTELFDFDNSNGKVSLLKKFNFPTTKGIEFSQDGTKLFVNTSNSTSDTLLGTLNGGSIYKIDLYARNSSGKLVYPIITVYKTNPSDPTIFGAMQLAPDGSVIVAQKNNQSCLGVLRPFSGEYKSDGICYSSGNIILELPNFLQSYFLYPSATYVSASTSCFKNSNLFNLYSPLKEYSFAKLSIDINFGEPSSGTLNTGFTTDSITHLYKNYGKYDVVYNENTACDTLFNKKISVTVFPLPKFDVGDTVVCKGASLPAISGGNNNFSGFTATYKWFDLNKQKVDSVEIFKPKSKGSYIGVINFDKCLAVDTFEIKEDNSLPVSLEKNISGCIGDGLILQPINVTNGNFLWSNGDITKSTKVFQDGKYYLNYLSKGGCISKDSVSVTFFAKPLNYLIPLDTIICDGNSITAQYMASGYSYRWNGGELSQSAIINAPGDYYVDVTNFGCTQRFNGILNYFPKQKIDLKPTYYLCKEDNQKIVLDAGEGSNFEWQPTAVSTQLFVVEDADVYTLVKIDTNKCENKYLFNVKLKCSAVLFIPDIFTPNEDGDNDVFYVVSKHIIDFNFKIFNRWGEMIFYSNSPLLGWNGTYNQIPCINGAYSYTISYKSDEIKGLSTFYKSGILYLTR